MRVGHSKVLIWQNDFSGLKCSNPICGKTAIDENVCIFCQNAKRISGKLGRIK